MLFRLIRLIKAYLSYDGRWNLNRLHPFDQARATDTGGFIAAKNLRLAPDLRRAASAYAAVQPSIAGRLLERLREDGLTPADYGFVDLGCGKGRALLIAAEMGFASITGVEADGDLARVARANLRGAGVAAEIVEGDAALYEASARRLVVFLYNPFGEDVMRRVRDRLAAACRAGRVDHAFVVYHNAVQAHLFDNDPAFARYYAAQYQVAEGERPFAFAHEGVSVIWQAGRAVVPTPHQGAEAGVTVLSGVAEFA